MTKLSVAVLVAGGLAVGCASSGAPPDGGGRSDGGGTAICPDHPEQCGGECCGEVCVDTSLDPRSCGGCDKACATGEVCAGGKCGCLPTGAPCGLGQSCCGASGCKSLMSDINNCGGCGNACGVGSGVTCKDGRCLCGGVACPAGQVCCDGTCAVACAMDMGTTPPDQGNAGGLCQCAGGCLIMCVGADCCYEDLTIFGGSCTASSSCEWN